MMDSEHGKRVGDEDAFDKICSKVPGDVGFLRLLSATFVFIFACYTSKFNFVTVVLSPILLYTWYRVFNHILSSDHTSNEETDVKKLEARSEGAENVVYLTSGQRNVFIEHLRKLLREEKCKREKIESEFEESFRVEKDKLRDEQNKLIETFKAETISLVEQFRVSEEEMDLKLSVKQKELSELKRESTDLAYALVKEGHTVSELRDHCARLDQEKAHVANELEEERYKVSELQDRMLVLEDSEHELREQCAVFQAMKLHQGICSLDDEWPEFSDLRDNFVTLENNNANNTTYNNELDVERYKVLQLEQNNAALQHEKEQMWNLVWDLWQRLWDLQELNATFMAEKESIVCEVDEKRAALEEEMRSSMKQLKIADEEQNKKVWKLEQQYNQLKEEKRVWSAEKESLLMLLNSQATAVEAYKDMSDKEECLIKLFQNSKLSFCDSSKQ